MLSAPSSQHKAEKATCECTYVVSAVCTGGLSRSVFMTISRMWNVIVCTHTQVREQSYVLVLYVHVHSCTVCLIIVFMTQAFTSRQMPGSVQECLVVPCRFMYCFCVCRQCGKFWATTTSLYIPGCFCPHMYIPRGPHYIIPLSLDPICSLVHH